MREPEAAEYIEAGRGWDRDRRQVEQRMLKLAWAIAGVAVLGLLVAVAAVAALTPLKRVEPYLVRVDASSGVVDVVPVYEGKAPLPEAVTRALLTQYVTTRERYVAALAEADYEQVGAYHTPPLNQAWAQAWDRNNPDSPLNVHRDGSSVRVQIQSITFLAPASGAADLAQVRFFTESGSVDGAPMLAHWVATLRYGYGRPASDPKHRGLNPLGFKVESYAKEPEVVAAPSVSAPPAAPAVQAAQAAL